MDLEKAVELYRKSHEQHYPAGTCSLGVCYEFGKGVVRDAKRAAQLYREAAESISQL